MVQKVKSVIGWVVLVLAFILSVSLINSISKIAGSNQKITDAQNKLDELGKENKELDSKFHAVKSAQFIERQARDKLGLAKKGEIVVVLPDDNTLKSLAPKVEDENWSFPDPNWKLWLKLFL